MTDRPSKTLPDLEKDWPRDPANEDLARLGQDLFANRPELSQLALDRIQIRMRQEMTRPWWQRRLRKLIACTIATIALAIGLYTFFTIPTPHTNITKHPEERTIQDHYEITLPPTTPRPPKKPLIDLQQNNDLFKPDTKAPPK